MSWNEFWFKANKLASVFRSYGLNPGDKVAVVLPTSLHWELIDKAALRAGLVVVGLEPHMTQDSVDHIIRATQPAALVTPTPELALKLGELVHPKLLVSIQECYDLYEHVTPWSSLLRQSELAAPLDSSPLPDSPAALFFTSGTTGQPKAVLYSHKQLLLAARSILSAMGPFSSQDSTIAWLPMANPFQRVLNLAALIAGIPLHFLDDPQQLMSVLPQIRPTFLIGVPSLYEKMYQGVIDKLNTTFGGSILKKFLAGAMALARRSSAQRPPFWTRSYLALIRRIFRPVLSPLGGRMRFMVSGSAPCRKDVLLFFHALGLPLLEAYGVMEIEKHYSGAFEPVPGMSV